MNELKRSGMGSALNDMIGDSNHWRVFFLHLTSGYAKATVTHVYDDRAMMECSLFGLKFEGKALTFDHTDLFARLGDYTGKTYKVYVKYPTWNATIPEITVCE